ncbi:hypothetical protein BOTBODRAFT_27508 [Botryobasidium botryosum FD-172 SS1]|uniref:PABS domain-containing protein n=1 Tax=Botryobasidium botryosum (strain FD-172 SS1) TaxID=930990 RepID=A0A067N8H4_BOTB1|nr:hypothetical protein BOTBODRAFT_27508 [Botryobasidium botryosum FD-172 SS1]
MSSKNSKSSTKPSAHTKDAAQVVGPGIPPSVLSVLAKSLLLMGGISVANIACQLSLHPLYGSIPTSTHFDNIMLASALFSTFIPSFSEAGHLSGIAALLALAPVTAFRIGSSTARYGDPLWGPVLTHLALTAPIDTLGVSLIRKWAIQLVSDSPNIAFKSGLRLAIFFALKTVENILWKRLPIGGRVDSSNLFYGSSALFAIGALASIVLSSVPAAGTKGVKRHAQGKAGILSIVGLLAPIILGLFTSTQPPYSHPEYPYLTANGTINVLARTQGVTGTIVIAEDVKMSLRYMRCDHSLLGGRWVIKAPTGDSLSESIYATFVLQDAVRLVKRSKVPKGEPERALTIGLGVGIGAAAFTERSIQTTIVEIDPAVYTYAREFFDLPEPHAVYLEDARGWVRERAGVIPESERFDYVVHDCFSGGSVPMHMFASEFWSDLKGVIKPDGVVAVNFAGVLVSDASRSILATLLRSFAQCRIFHDGDVDSGEELKPSGFINIIIFCTPSADSFEFRASDESDYLGSYMRQILLSSLPRREIDIKMIRGDESPADEKWILSDTHNPLEEWQRASAMEHWKIMRTVLPAHAWEAY